MPARSTKKSGLKKPYKKKKPVIIEMVDLVLPGYTNAYKTLFGGKLMELIDKAAAICAMRYCQQPVVTASVEAVDFHAPIKEGAVIQLIARIIYVGRSSVMIKTQVNGEDPFTSSSEHCCTAYVTMVAIDAEGKPQEVPPLAVESEEEKQAWQDGLNIRNNTLARREAALKNSKAAIL